MRLFNQQQKRTNFKLTILLFFIFLTGNLLAQDKNITLKTDSNMSGNEFKQAINMCPGGVIFGIYAFNYEYLLNRNHGLVVRFDYESVSETVSGEDIDANGYVYTLNYRWHFAGAMESFYIGSYARYKYYNGDGTSDPDKFDLEIHEYTIGLNGGKRWVWDSGFNVNVAFGYGISSISKESDPESPSAKSTLKEFIDDYEFIDPFYGEISIGWAL